MKVAQAPWELEMVTRLFDLLAPAKVLEIGVWYGGTLREWLQPGVTVVAIDDGIRNVHEWGDWASNNESDLHVLWGSSNDPLIVERAANHGPYDFAFVDADHTYESVKQDWENYRPMMCPGAVMCFHDINPRDGYGVDRFWEEISRAEGARTLEIRQREPYDAPDLTAGYSPGIGCVWV